MALRGAACVRHTRRGPPQTCGGTVTLTLVPWPPVVRPIPTRLRDFSVDCTCSAGGRVTGRFQPQTSRSQSRIQEYTLGTQGPMHTSKMPPCKPKVPFT